MGVEFPVFVNAGLEYYLRSFGEGRECKGNGVLMCDRGR